MIATITDVRTAMTPDVVRSIKLEFEVAQPDKKFHSASFVEAWDQLIARGMGGIWVLSQGGMFVGATGAICHIEPVEGIMVVAQAFMILRHGYQGPTDASKLIEQVELFARGKKASRIVTSVCYDTMDGRQAEFLKRIGYAPYETRFYKNTSWEQKP